MPTVEREGREEASRRRGSAGGWSRRGDLLTSFSPSRTRKDIEVGGRTHGTATPDVGDEEIYPFDRGGMRRGEKSQKLAVATVRLW